MNLRLCMADRTTATSCNRGRSHKKDDEDAESAASAADEGTGLANGADAAVAWAQRTRVQGTVLPLTAAPRMPGRVCDEDKDDVGGRGNKDGPSGTPQRCVERFRNFCRHCRSGASPMSSSLQKN